MVEPATACCTWGLMLLQAMDLFHLLSLISVRSLTPRHIAWWCIAELRQLATVSNNDRLASLATGAAKGFNLLNYIHALGDTAKDNVLAVQPLGLDCAQEELQNTRSHCQQKPPTPSKSRYTCSYYTIHCSIPHNDADDLHQLIFTTQQTGKVLSHWFHLTCEPLVLAPAFAIDKMPATEQTCSKHSLSLETYTYLYQQLKISQQRQPLHLGQCAWVWSSRQQTSRHRWTRLRYRFHEWSRHPTVVTPLVYNVREADARASESSRSYRRRCHCSSPAEPWLALTRYSVAVQVNTARHTLRVVSA